MSTTPTVTYTVERSTDAGATWQTQASGLFGTFWQDETPVPGVVNLYRIQASDAFWSTTGGSLGITPPCAAPVAPTLSQVTASTHVAASWNWPTGSASGSLQRSDDTGQTWSPLVTGSSTNYTDTATTAYQHPFYRVVATGTGGSVAGPASAIVVQPSAGQAAGLTFVVAGVDLSALVDRDTAPTIDFQVSTQRGEAHFTLLYPNPGTLPTLKRYQPVLVFDSGALIFSGWVTHFALTSPSVAIQEAAVTAQDASSLLGGTVVADVFEGISTGLAVKNLLARNFPGVALGNGVADGPTLPYTVFSHVSLDQALRRLLLRALPLVSTPNLFFNPSGQVSLAYDQTLPNAPVSLTDGDSVTGAYPG